MSKSRKVKRTAWDHPGKPKEMVKYARDEVEYRMCAKKSGAYGNEKEALSIAANFTSRPTPTGTWRAYECPYCHKWHLTTDSQKDSK